MRSLSRHRRVLGIDPGLKRTGYGVVARVGRSYQVVEAGIIRPGSERLPLEQRLAAVFDGVAAVLVEYLPDAVALEEVFSHARFPGSALWIAHARGVVCLAAARAAVPVYSYAPASLKQAVTGNGRATKEQVQHFVGLRLALAQPPSSSDMADALALAITHLDATGMIVDDSPPRSAAGRDMAGGPLHVTRQETPPAQTAAAAAPERGR